MQCNFIQPLKASAKDYLPHLIEVHAKQDVHTM